MLVFSPPSYNPSPTWVKDVLRTRLIVYMEFCCTIQILWNLQTLTILEKSGEFWSTSAKTANDINAEMTFVFAEPKVPGLMGGGMAACVYGGFSSFEDYVIGVQMDFIPFHMAYAFIKTFVFAFLLATIPSFHGYYMKGGALEVGKASTTAFVWTSVSIILLNYILTQMLLS